MPKNTENMAENMPSRHYFPVQKEAVIAAGAKGSYIDVCLTLGRQREGALAIILGPRARRYQRG